MIDTTRDFATHVAAHAGLAMERCERATTIVLGRLGAYLARPQRQLVADELPPGLAMALLDPGDLAVPLEELVLSHDAAPGHARELIASVCRVLSEALSQEALDALRDVVPADLAAMLQRPAPEIIRDPVAPWERDTIATGRPGSHHPVAEVPANRTQTDSVASPDPHGSTKLSGAVGPTQERRNETLSSADPSPSRPLSGSRH